MSENLENIFSQSDVFDCPNPQNNSLTINNKNKTKKQQKEAANPQRNW